MPTDSEFQALLQRLRGNGRDATVFLPPSPTHIKVLKPSLFTLSLSDGRELPAKCFLSAQKGDAYCLDVRSVDVTVVQQEPFDRDAILTLCVGMPVESGAPGRPVRLRFGDTTVTVPAILYSLAQLPRLPFDLPQIDIPVINVPQIPQIKIPPIVPPAPVIPQSPPRAASPGSAPAAPILPADFAFLGLTKANGPTDVESLLKSGATITLRANGDEVLLSTTRDAVQGLRGKGLHIRQDNQGNILDGSFRLHLIWTPEEFACYRDRRLLGIWVPAIKQLRMANADETPATLPENNDRVASDSHRSDNQASTTDKPADDWRVWTSADGEHRTEAKFLKFQDSKVVLEKRDGSVVQLRMTRPVESRSAIRSGNVSTAAQRETQSLNRCHRALSRGIAERPGRHTPPSDRSSERWRWFVRW